MSNSKMDSPVPGVPELSVVVALIAGGAEKLRVCLTSLAKSAEGYHVQYLVPYDNRLDQAEEVAREFPWVEFIDARSLVPAQLFGAFSREHHDILRATGLRYARGRIVALLEDHARPADDWCEMVLKAHQLPYAAVGGAVENDVDRPLNWAVYYSDFGRYQNPVPDGPAEYLSDSNISYKREELARIAPLWADRYHETVINNTLRHRGCLLYLNPRVVVYQNRDYLHLLPALRERYVWGRSYAGTRARTMTRSGRFIYTGFSFLLPMVLTARILRRAWQTRRYRDRVLRALPLILVLETVWATGEFVGYLTARPDSHQRAPLQTQPSSLVRHQS